MLSFLSNYICKNLILCIIQNEIIIGWVILQEQFVEEIYSSGMLMYVSNSWLSELYQHVLVTNMLVLSGYETQTTGHLALIDLLTGSYCVLFGFKLDLMYL